MDSELNALIDRIKQGDEIAFNILCEKYSALTESTARRFAPSLGLRNGAAQNADAADMEELKQDAIMALYRAAVTYDSDGDGREVSFGLYAKICMNNAMITKVRKYKRKLKRLEKRKSVMSAEKRVERYGRGGRYEEDAASQRIDLEALSETLKGALEELSDYERKTFDLYVDGKTVKEIAAELNRSEKSVSNACYRVKTKIRGILKKE